MLSDKKGLVLPGDDAKPIYSASSERTKVDYRPLVAGKPVLVVVDMQSRFSAANDKTTIEAVAAEIRGAIARQEPIVVLELAIPSMSPSFCRTHQCLLDILESRENPAFWVLKLKSTVDGAREVLTACNTFGFSQEHFRLCGVNTALCVYETAMGLARRRPGAKVEVLRRAVNCSTEHPWLNYPLVSAMVSVV